ncbi:MAG: inner membrane-spanning protein YciB, partial [Methyloceanibacter sp.]
MKQPPKSKVAVPGEAASSQPALLPKLAIELGPLLVFFGGNAVAGIYAGTAAFMVATLISLAVARFRYHKLPVMPLVSGVIVLVFGGLTLYLQDETFIKLKPTIVYSMFAVLL